MSETTLATVVQQFDYDTTYALDKILVQLPSGQQMFLWYDWYANPIIPKPGAVITLTYSGYGSSLELYKIINTGMGKETSVMRYAYAN